MTMQYGNADGPMPLNEIGSVVNDPGFIAPWTILQAQDELEENPKLQFPESIRTYHNMRPDPQVQGLLTGAIWPLLRMKWYISPNGAQEEAVIKISKDLNLPIGVPQPIAVDPLTGIQTGGGIDFVGTPGGQDLFFQRRTQNRFKFLDHLETAMDAVAYGFQAFEQVGFIGDDGLFHYSKLAPRLPQTISEMRIQKDGGLEWIKQYYVEAPELPIDRLVMYPFAKRGANWHGRSMLRGCYGPWLLKDRAMRVGVMNIQRAGVGTPVATGHPGASETDLIILSELARKMTGGDRSGGAIPYGSQLRLIGVEGTQPDTAGFIHLLNEEMARAFFSMFMQLGQTTAGSRALGETFVQYHKLVIEYIAQWFASIFNEHVIEDDIEWNYGPDEEYAPLLCWAWDEEGSESNPEGPVAAKNPAQGHVNNSNNGKTTLPEDIHSALER